MAGRSLHSRIVAVLKVGLPLVALGLLAALFLFQPEDQPKGLLVFSQADIAALGSGLRVSNPTFTGMTRRNDAFRFTADLVIPDAAPPTRASITALTGEVDFVGGPTVTLTAAHGELDIAAQKLDLGGAVRVETSDGYRVAAPRMTLDLRGGVMEAEGGVETDGPMGRIDAPTLRIAPDAADSGARAFLFGNGVRLLYDPP